MSQLAEQLQRAADQFTCHSASQSIDQIEAAGELMRKAAAVVQAASTYAESHEACMAAEEVYKWSESGDSHSESAWSEAKAQEKGAHWQLLYECRRAQDPETAAENAVNAKSVQESFVKLIEQDVDAALILITGMFVGLTLEYSRRRGHEPSGDIRIDGGDMRDITIHAPKLTKEQRAQVRSRWEGEGLLVGPFM